MDTHISSKTSVVVAVIAAVLAVLWLPVGAASPRGPITEYTLPSADSSPSGPQVITAGPDGNLWFTERYNKVGRITPGGNITEYPLPSADSTPSGLDDIVAGPDGNVWFTETDGNRIGRITPSGSITEYPLPSADSSPSSPYEIANRIVAGPDGNLWFTEPKGNRIGRITPGGIITVYPIPTADSRPTDIAAGPDGSLWFTEYFNKVGRITPGGIITEYPDPTTRSFGSGLLDIVAGPDGNMWFTEFYECAIGRITPSGIITEFSAIRGCGQWDVQRDDLVAGPDGNLWLSSRGVILRVTPDGTITRYSLPHVYTRAAHITAGPDGNLWFTESDSRDPDSWQVWDRGRIGRITPNGVVTEYPVPSAGGFPVDLTAGPDGNLWFTEFMADRIGRITPGVERKPCRIDVTLHRPVPKTVGDQILTDKITPKTSCVLGKRVVRCRPLVNPTSAKTFCVTKVSKRGQIRVKTLHGRAVRVTVIVRAKPKLGFADTWKPNTWRKSWPLR